MRRRERERERAAALQLFKKRNGLHTHTHELKGISMLYAGAIYIRWCPMISSVKYSAMLYQTTSELGADLQLQHSPELRNIFTFIFSLGLAQGGLRTHAHKYTIICRNSYMLYFFSTAQIKQLYKHNTTSLRDSRRVDKLRHVK